jgi:hypothetical protein
MSRKPYLAITVPHTVDKRLEIVEAIRVLAAQDQDRRLQRRAQIAGIRHDLLEVRGLFQDTCRQWLVDVRSQLRSALQKYDPDEPRVPAGNPDGGQWTTEDIQVAQNDDKEDQSDAIQAPRGEGHHWVPKGVYEKESLQPTTKEVFDDAISGPLADNNVNRWNAEHRAYNDAVQGAFNAFLQTNNVTPEDLTPEQAQDFVDQVKASSDPRIYNLKMKILHQALRFIEIWNVRGGDED